tara:strand:- start:204 stop:1727 length:1524 start_codon:yes stop_codon:yes gene_type:complete
MGIPLFYKHVITQHPEIITESKQKIDVNYLLFDLNCAIHPCCAGKTNENEMFSAILDKIKECIEITGVKDIIYIAIDGPAPRTKMEQQRQRRLKSSQENKKWDTNQITPGTPFMKRLNKFLKNEIKNFPVTTVLSDSNEPGEGEHKIMDFLDKNVDKDTISVVYGLDADLIMLSMIRKHNIYLLRERTEYNIEGLQDHYIYLNVRLLKEYRIESIKEINPVTQYKISDEKILNDFLFFCFLIGNDFIIPSPCNNLRYGGMGYLENAYSSLQNDNFGMFYLIEDDFRINMDNFCKFINEIAKREKSAIDRTMKKRGSREYHNRNRYGKYLQKIKSIEDIKHYTFTDFSNSDEKEFNDFINSAPTIFRKHEEIIFKHNNYRNMYYTHNIYNTYNLDPSIKMLLEKDIFKLCEDYLKSIVWTFEYYFKGCPEWRWYYPHDLAPLMIDFHEYLTKNNGEITFNNDEPYSPEQQLKIVLPKLEKNFMYPEDTPVYSFFKTYMWECHAILPHL